MTSITIEIGGRAFAVAPYKLGDLRRAAPFIDEMNRHFQETQALAKRNVEAVEALLAANPEADEDEIKAVQEAPALATLALLSRALIEILAIGLTKVEPAMTADAIEDEVDFSFIPSLQIAILALLSASGLSRKGEAQAPSGLEPEGAGSPSSSDALSTS